MYFYESGTFSRYIYLSFFKAHFIAMCVDHFFRLIRALADHFISRWIKHNQNIFFTIRPQIDKGVFLW